MGIFGKKHDRHDADGGFVSGCGSVTEEQIDEIVCRELFDLSENADVVKRAFCYGSLAAFTFLTVPEGQDMARKPLGEFLDNAWHHIETTLAYEEAMDGLFLTIFGR